MNTLMQSMNTLNIVVFNFFQFAGHMETMFSSQKKKIGKNIEIG